MIAARSASNNQRSRTILPRTHRLELLRLAARSASNNQRSRTILPRTHRLELQQGRRSPDSERSAELIRKHGEPTPFLLPKVLTRVSARSESADAHRPLRLERQTASNRSASTLKNLEPFRLEPQNDLEPSCLELLRLAPPTGAAGIGQRTQRGTYSEARRAYSLPPT